MLYKWLSGIGTKILTYCVLAVCLTVFALFHAADPLLAAVPWPDGLKEAVYSYFQTLQVTEYRTRDSTLEEPLGVQPMTSFDRTSHKCHEIPGQVYRVYKIPSSYSQDQDGTFLVRSRFELFYRQADSIAEVLSTSWGQGSDGAIQVRFEKVEGNWEAVETKELLE
jgi:hypothetical protein